MLKIEEAVKEVKKLVKEDGYEGQLTEGAVKAMAEVYAGCCGEDGELRPRRWMRAANGKATNLTAVQWMLTRTPAFKRWFGESKVVDENGEPKVMWHGSSEDFKEFKVEAIHVNKSLMTLWSGPGFYFTDKKRVAIIYGKKGGTVKEVFLKLENPLVVDETGNAEKWSDHITRAEAEKILLEGDNTQWLDSNLAAVLARMDEADGVKRGGKHYYKGLTRKERVAEYVKRLKTDVVKLKVASEAFGAKSQKRMLDAICKHTGFDGVIHKIAPEVTEYVVYDPKAIKSATANDGEFSGGSAVTLDSLGAAQPSETAGAQENLQGKEKEKEPMKKLIDAFGVLAAKAAAKTEPKKQSGLDAAICGIWKYAEDIVDRQGRHHEMKGIPPGGQYMEEGQFAKGSAAIALAVNRAGSGKRAQHLRENLAPAYARIVENDSTTRATIQKMRQDFAGKSKHELMRMMATHLNDMLKHKEAYEAVKDMSKEEFAAWLQQNPDYNTGIVRKLMEDRRYNGRRAGQEHEAWEEAKWSVGARAVTSAMMFREAEAAKNHEPPQIMEHAIQEAMEERPAQENVTRREEPAQVENREGGEGGENQTQTATPDPTATPANGGGAQNANGAAQGTQNANGAENAEQPRVTLPEMNLQYYGTDNDRGLRGQQYEWPARRGQQITAEQVTPELARSVAMNMPTGYGAYRHMRYANLALDALRNPDGLRDSQIDWIRDHYFNPNARGANNRHAQRYVQMFNALHPGWMDGLAQRREEARLAREAQYNRGRVNDMANIANTVAREAATVQTPEASRVNFSAEDATDAVNRIVQSVGEENRQRVQQAMDAFRNTGNIPSDARGHLGNMLPTDHPVMRAIRDAELRTANEEERIKIRARDFRPTVDESVKNSLKQMAQANGVSFDPNGIATISAQGSGYNCYLTALVYGMRRAGLNIPFKSRPSGYGQSSQAYFIPTKQAMADAGWEPVQGATREETIANLNRLAQTKPNGYAIECWSSGHHGTHAYLLDGKWIWNDVYGGTFTKVYDSSQLAGHIGNVGPNGNGDMDETQKRVAKVAILRGLDPVRRREMTEQQKNEYVEEKLKQSRYVAESSFGHSPEHGFSDELIKQVLRN